MNWDGRKEGALMFEAIEVIVVVWILSMVVAVLLDGSASRRAYNEAKRKGKSWD